MGIRILYVWLYFLQAKTSLKQGGFLLFRIMNVPAECHKFRCLGGIEHIVILKLCQVEETIICLLFLVTEDTFELRNSSARRLLNNCAEVVVLTHEGDDIGSSSQQLVADVVYACVLHIIGVLYEAEDEVYQIVYTAELESILTLAVYEL